MVPLRFIASGVLFFVSAAGIFAETPPPGAHKRAPAYREHVVLAKPRAASRASVERDEIREHVRVREKFARFGDLRVIELDAADSVSAAVARLQATGRYEFVEPDYVMLPDVAPNDPSYSSQWSLNNTGQLAGSIVGADIDAPAAWDIVHDAPGVVVALIDNGVNPNHQDIAPNLWKNPSPTFGDVNGASIIGGVRSGNIVDQDGHGSHVAGIICAAGNNGVGIAGVAWRVQLMVLKNSAADGGSLSSDSAACIDYAVAHGAQIINCSFGGNDFSETFFTAIQAARDAGVIVVCSAGNDGVSNDISPHYPANYLLDNLLSVGSSTPADGGSSFSDYGVLVDLFAPGSSIRSLDYASTSGTIVESGTSMAAPHVTGALALLKAHFPSDNYHQLINRLLRGCEIKTAFAARAVTNGRLNVFRALTATSNRPFNDDFLTRAVIAGSLLTLRSNNSGATVETGEPVHAAGGTKSLWWNWVATTSGNVVFDTSGSDHATGLDVYSGSASSTFSTLVPVTSNDTSGGGQTSRVSFKATAGSSYIIAVSARNDAEGYTQLNIASAPLNDAFAGAESLTGESAQATGNNLASSLEAGEPPILGFDGGASLWYKWTAPRSGHFQVSAFSFQLDALLAIYTGSSLANLTLTAADDDTDVSPGVTNTDSRCTIDAVAGTTYYFQVDSKTSDRGEVVVSVTDSVWQYSSKGLVSGAPAVGPDGTIYIVGGVPDTNLYAVAPDGTLKWTYAAKTSSPDCSPAIGADGTIFFGSNDNRFTALSPDGTVRWQRTLDVTLGISPAIATDGTVYARGSDGYLYALDPASGNTKWRYHYTAITASSTYASPSIGPDGTVYLGAYDQTLTAVKPDGSLKWQFTADNVIYSSPAIDTAGNIYFTSYNPGKLWSLTPAGTLRWTYAIGGAGEISASPTLSADGATVYFGDNERNFHAVNTADGVRRWRLTLGEGILASTAAIDRNGVLYVGCYDGKLYAITPGGTLKRTWDTAEFIRSSPAIFGTMLYVGSTDGKLYAFDIGASAAGGPWPQYHNNARRLGRSATDALAITGPPQSQNATGGNPVTLRVAVTGQAPFDFQWSKNGVSIAGATLSSYTIAGDAASAGLYTVAATGSQGTVTTTPVIVGVSSTAKVSGAGEIAGSNITHPNGNIFDQVSVTGTAETITADPGKVTRTSYVDLNDDIVQVEFSGAGTLSLTLDNSSGPAFPLNYAQAVNYMKGHASIVIAGANESTNVSVFTVGRTTAFDPTGVYNILLPAGATNNPANNGSSLFAGHSATNYDGVADLALIAISSLNGKFGGVRTANAGFFATTGYTGLYAPGVEFTGPVNLENIDAFATTIPLLQIGSADAGVRITGGNLKQDNGRAVQVEGVAQLLFTAGVTSQNKSLPAQINQGRLEHDGIDVTAQIVVNPAP